MVLVAIDFEGLIGAIFTAERGMVSGSVGEKISCFDGLADGLGGLLGFHVLGVHWISFWEGMLPLEG